VGGERWREAETLSVREGEAETIGLSRERKRDTVEREYGGHRSWSAMGRRTAVGGAPRVAGVWLSGIRILSN
jgi:hypothetical protein